MSHLSQSPSTSPDKKILLIGWDAADWKAITPLLDAGKMPNLAKLIEGGTIGNLATLQPVLSPMLWSSIATGKRPYKHGIHGFSEPDPVTGGIRPVTNLSRKTKAIWNILNQEEKNTITVGWWPSNPAEPLSKGVMVSNDYQHAHGNTYEPEKWPMKPGTVHPQHLADKLKELRFHPAELDQEDLLPFLPGLQGLDQEDLDKAAKDPRMQSLMKIIADCTSVHSAATALLVNEPWNLAAVYYDAIDHFGHGFMKYHPPQRKGVDDWEYRLFNYVIEAGYLYHDMLLGTLMEIAREIDPETTIILMSDHGFHPDDLRLSNIPREPAGPAAEHRQFGILAINGPGIKKDDRVYGANLLDICPTLLHLFGLPVGEDMDGKVLLDIYENAPSDIDRIPSWDDVDGDHGMHAPDKQISAEDSKAALDQLVALGYIDEPDADKSTALDNTVRELDYNLAQAWIDGGIYTEAISILEKLYEKWPLEHRFGFKLATCYQSLGRSKELRELVTIVIERRIKEAEDAVAEIKELKLDDEEAQKAEEEKLEKMSEQEKKQFSRNRRDLFSKARPNLFSLRYLEASADFAEKNYEDALTKLEQLDDDFGARRNALTLRGEIFSRLKRWDQASEAFNQALEIDDETPGPLLGLARVALAQHDFEAAIDYTRTSLGLLFFQPRAHYILGMAYYRLSQFEEAEQAFLICVRQAPLFSAAYRMLGQIAQWVKKDASETVMYKQQVKTSRAKMAEVRQSKQLTAKAHGAQTNEPSHEATPEIEFAISAPEQDNADVITIVSGLPRSGTSLMMQVLEAAGIPAFTDGNREADDSNKKGYYEHDKVAGLLKPNERQWIAEAQGQALKVVAPLLAALPLKTKKAEFKYRILFMERDMDEILESQTSMLKRLDKEQPKGDVSRAYVQQVNNAKSWVNTQQIPALSVSYETLVHQPETLLTQLAQFLGTEDKLDTMKAVIDPDMHRARKN